MIQYLKTIIHQFTEVLTVLQDIVALLARIDAALKVISDRLQGLAGGLTAAEAQEIKDAASALASKAESLVQ